MQQLHPTTLTKQLKAPASAQRHNAPSQPDTNKEEKKDPVVMTTMSSTITTKMSTQDDDFRLTGDKVIYYRYIHTVIFISVNIS